MLAMFARLQLVREWFEVELPSASPMTKERDKIARQLSPTLGDVTNA